MSARDELREPAGKFHTGGRVIDLPLYHAGYPGIPNVAIPAPVDGSPVQLYGWAPVLRRARIIGGFLRMGELAEGCRFAFPRRIFDWATDTDLDRAAREA